MVCGLIHKGVATGDHAIYIPFMCAAKSNVEVLAATLRRQREARGLSIATLAAAVGVSPRLVSEFERGKRPHVSLETAMRLLEHVGSQLSAVGSAVADEETNRAERAARRRRSWTGSFSTLAAQSAPPPPAEFAERLLAVAEASKLANGLRSAHERTARTTKRGGTHSPK